jgi:hypothetical protein
MIFRLDKPVGERRAVRVKQKIIHFQFDNSRAAS